MPKDKVHLPHILSYDLNSSFLCMLVLHCADPAHSCTLCKTPNSCKIVKQKCQIADVDGFRSVPGTSVTKTVRMFKDDKVAITRNRITTIDDFARSCGCNSRAFLQVYFYTFVNFLALLAELVQDLAFSWPDKDPLGRLAWCH